MECRHIVNSKIFFNISKYLKWKTCEFWCYLLPNIGFQLPLLQLFWNYSRIVMLEETKVSFNRKLTILFDKQARKAHSSAFCIDLHRQTLMAMMDNDHNDGQWWQWRQWCHWRYRWFTHLPHLSTLSWRQCLRTGTLPIPLRNLPQSQCFALALYCNEEVKNILIV